MDLDNDIVIIGGGPIGMTIAYMLAQRGQRSMLIEKSKTTTNQPKMELTTQRSMEIYRRIGLLERVRAKAVPEHFSFDERWATGFGGDGMPIASWVSIF
jgi:2-polyprenyl-6-methoxyphenol hydroxylase-like FAD-dependent oxidoreductase